MPAWSHGGQERAGFSLFSGIATVTVVLPPVTPAFHTATLLSTKKAPSGFNVMLAIAFARATLVAARDGLTSALQSV